MSKLNTQTNLSEHDDVYQCIVDMHEGRSIEESLKVTAKFALLLANHIGDPEIVKAATKIAGARNAA